MTEKTYRNEMERLRERLRLYRLRNGLTFRELGEQVGLSQVAVYRFIRTRCRPWESSLYKIEDYLKRKEGKR